MLTLGDASDPPGTAFFDAPVPDAPAPYGRQLERSILDMVQEQSSRLQAMSDELETVRTALNERKVVERAKGLLMAHRRISEQEAHKMLRQTAMNQGRRLIDVAESVLSMAEFLPRNAAP
ncbi:ANTAR domain-containing response regulator [Variovorax ureilyticus]|uniref:ANTAR domain-containing response regulator n=1 Tax=Variovorax ureilyticus TaxID=1836198 RepID=UPI003D6729E8